MSSEVQQVGVWLDRQVNEYIPRDNEAVFFNLGVATPHLGRLEFKWSSEVSSNLFKKKKTIFNIYIYKFIYLCIYLFIYIFKKYK